MRRRILCFGDSNTWGANPAAGGRYDSEVRWTGVMKRELGAGFEVIEEGFNGRTSVWDDPVEGRLAGITYFGPCLDSQSPLDMVILMLGTNDMKMRFGVSAKTIAYGMGRYLETLSVSSMTGEKPKVLLASPIHIEPAYRSSPLLYDMFGENGVERSKELAAAYEEFAREAGIYYFNAALHAKASEVDGVHMMPESHETLGMAFSAKVKEIFNETETRFK